MTAQDYIVIVDPAAELQSTSVTMAPRLASLKGIRLGMIDNSKHMAASLLAALETVLERDAGVASFEHYRKANPSVAMPADVIAGMAGRCDAVVHGVAD